MEYSRTAIWLELSSSRREAHVNGEALAKGLQVVPADAPTRHVI